jgi:hypothetical protein
VEIKYKKRNVKSKIGGEDEIKETKIGGEETRLGRNACGH